MLSQTCYNKTYNILLLSYSFLYSKHKIHIIYYIIYYLLHLPLLQALSFYAFLQIVHYSL